MKKSMLMYVYNNLSNDARVQRSARALSDSFNIEVIANDAIEQKKYKVHVLFENKQSGVINYLKNSCYFFQYVYRKHWSCFYANDYYSALLALFMKEFHLCDKLVYDAHELYIPQQGINMGLREKIFYYLEKSAIKKADLVIAAQEDRAIQMRLHYHLAVLPTTVRNVSVFDEKNVSEALPAHLQKKLNKFMSIPLKTLVYAGAISGSRGLYELCDILDYFKDTLKVLIIGDGPIKGELENYVKTKQTKNICFLGRISYRAMPEVLRMCNIGYLYYENDCLNNRFSSPNKVYEYLSCGLVILANDNEGVKRELTQFGAGIATDHLILGMKEILKNYDNYSLHCNSIDINTILSDEMEKLKLAVSNVFDGGSS